MKAKTVRKKKNQTERNENVLSHSSITGVKDEARSPRRALPAAPVRALGRPVALAPVPTVPQCSLPGRGATSTMQNVLCGKTAALMQWALC